LFGLWGGGGGGGRLNPWAWKEWLAELGFSWDRCYAVLRVSGFGTSTAYHMYTNRSNVLFWNVRGRTSSDPSNNNNL